MSFTTEEMASPAVSMISTGDVVAPAGPAPSPAAPVAVAPLGRASAASGRRGRAAAITVMLAAGAFVLGTGETMPVGVLSQMSASVGRPVSSVGALVTIYAGSLAVGGVLLAVFTARFARRVVVVGSLLVAVLANLSLSVSSEFVVLLLARVLGGAAHGLYVGAAISVALSVVPPARAGRAIASILTGLAASTAVGVPAGVLIAERSSWHAAFGVITALGAVLAVGLWVLTPRMEHQTGARPTVRSFRGLATAPVLTPLLFAFVLFAGQYAAFTYLDPFLQQVTGVSAGAVGGYVLAFGAAAIAGSFAGGRLADWNASRTLVLTALAPPVLMAVLLGTGQSAAAALPTVIAWGFVVVIAVPAVQYLVAAASGPLRDVAVVLPAAAINLGIAAGSLLGGRATAAFGLDGAIVAGIAISAFAVVVAVWSFRQVRRRTTPATSSLRSAEPVS